MIETLEIPFHLTGGSISSAQGQCLLTPAINLVVSPQIARNRVDERVCQIASCK